MRRISALVAVLLLTTACGSSPSPRGDGSSGALFGAYVSPSTATDAGRLRALTAFEERIGRPLAVVVSYHAWEQDFPSDFDRAVLERGHTELLLSWNGTSTADIRSGRYDELIRDRATALRTLGKPVLLRWRWEMNRPGVRDEVGSPASYVAAWRHVRAIFAAVGTPQVQWVWCPLANGFEETDAPSYYPGDDQVDWLCADAYTRDPSQPLADVLDPFLARARGHEKPVMIGEFGTHSGPDRAAWLDAAFARLQQESRMRAVLYYESANAPAGRYDLSDDPASLAVMRRWGASSWFNPPWAP